MTATDSNFDPDKETEYRMFLIWQILPKSVKQKGIEYLDKQGIEDEEIRELAGLKTQKEFAEHYGLREATLSEWKKRTVPKDLEDISPKTYMKHLVKNIYDLLYEGLEQRKDPATGKLLLEVLDVYTPKQEVQVSGTQELFDNVKALLEKADG